jgi:prepilin-type N-terminal cleavage/methylation domain-containing protein
MRQKGFTLIELLIVIALLGALAVGLLATIDPLEQVKKGRDTAMRGQVQEYYNANLRYYTSRQQFSWPTGSYTAGLLSGYTTSLVDAGEMKSSFLKSVGTANLAKIYVTSTAADQLAVCYQPQSKLFQQDPQRCTIAQVPQGSCKAGGAGTVLLLRPIIQ